MEARTVGMASDHAGYAMKEYLKGVLEGLGYKVRDFGAYSEERADYPDSAHPLALAVEASEVDFGVAVCGSGNGICMTLNKHQGIRAALCWAPELGRLAKAHNDANVLCLPGRFVTTDEAKAILEAYLGAEFEGGRHSIRIRKISCR